MYVLSMLSSLPFVVCVLALGGSVCVSLVLNNNTNNLHNKQFYNNIIYHVYKM